MIGRGIVGTPAGAAPGVAAAAGIVRSGATLPVVARDARGVGFGCGSSGGVALDRVVESGVGGRSGLASTAALGSVRYGATAAATAPPRDPPAGDAVTGVGFGCSSTSGAGPVAEATLGLTGTAACVTAGVAGAGATFEGMAAHDGCGGVGIDTAGRGGSAFGPIDVGAW